MGDFNQVDAFQKLMMMPGAAAGGMPNTRGDQFFQEYMNKKMQEDAQRRAIEMQEDQVRQFQRQREQEMLTGRGLFVAPDFKRRMFPQMGAIPGSMY
tara:strand:+ start:399 stop:689 length:291 start_codon:yes stop_codon:yes gene_type:complete